MIEQLVLNLEAEKLVNLSYIIGKYISVSLLWVAKGPKIGVGIRIYFNLVNFGYIQDFLFVIYQESK